jgi:RNA-directed DNA polymerase
MVFEDWAIMDDQPPAKRKGPPRSEIHAEQGKPIVLPATAGEPQGTLSALWVKECGKKRTPGCNGRDTG